MEIEPRPLETLDPMPAEPGKFVYGKSLSPNLDGRIPVGVPGGLATLNAEGVLSPDQRPAGGGGGGGGGGFVPTYIGEGETFTVPENTQALYALPILVDGDLVIDGDLVEVN